MLYYCFPASSMYANVEISHVLSHGTNHNGLRAHRCGRVPSSPTRGYRLPTGNYALTKSTWV
ncbi:hypothetical protein BJV74DRAFT_837039 [Russula compacta]|nr:hypothetical protein BJV74DRAFT_837039 [Russula compacta]